MLPVDLAANAASLGANVWRANTHRRVPRRARRRGRATRGVGVIVVPVDRESRVGGYESWWDVPVAEVSGEPARCRARARRTKQARRKERDFL